MQHTQQLPPLYHALFQQLHSCQHSGFASCKADVEMLYEDCHRNMDQDSASFLSALILGAYKNQFAGSGNSENIYLKQYDVSQIQLFNILIEKLPYVKYGQAITNQKIVELLTELTEATILDIGIGQGTQIRNILSQCAGLVNLKRLVIVGIEPYEEALALAKTTIMAMQDNLPFEIEFKAYPGFAENMDLTAIDYGTNNLIVNASLALHHIQAAEKRDQVFAQLKQLDPVAVFLIEPNVNHFEPDFMKRFEHCFHHFYSLFKTIDGLDISDNEKNALKLFFGREIEDIMGKPEDKRFEKHEPALHWLNRLQRHNYAVKSHLLQAPVQQEAGVQIAHHEEGFLGFTFENETVLSLIYAA